jgi:hypothetical protein
MVVRYFDNNCYGKSFFVCACWGVGRYCNRFSMFRIRCSALIYHTEACQLNYPLLSQTLFAMSHL